MFKDDILKVPMAIIDSFGIASTQGQTPVYKNLIFPLIFHFKFYSLFRVSSSSLCFWNNFCENDEKFLQTYRKKSTPSPGIFLILEFHIIFIFKLFAINEIGKGLLILFTNKVPRKKMS